MSTETVSKLSRTSLAKAFEQIFRDHAAMVYRTAYGVTGSREDAEDILQTIFLKLLRQEFPADLNKNPRAYLYRAAVNASLDTLKAKRRRPVLVTDIERIPLHGSETDSEYLEELHRRLYAAIGDLDPDDGQILILRYVHNYSDAQIAKMLGKSRTTIAVRLFRSRARLKRMLRASQGDKS